MTPADEMAMTFAGREKAYATMFRFMRVALRQAAAEPASLPTTPPLPFAQELRQQYQAFRSAHLAIPPNLPIPPELAQVFARSYRAQFDKLHKELLDELPEAGPAG